MWEEDTIAQSAIKLMAAIWISVKPLNPSISIGSNNQVSVIGLGFLFQLTSVNDHIRSCYPSNKFGANYCDLTMLLYS